MNEKLSPLAMASAGQAPEVTVSRDIIRRGLIIAPLIMVIAGVIWGLTGAWSAGLGLALVLMNFGLAAALISWAAPISLALMMGLTLFGFLLRRAYFSCCFLGTRRVMGIPSCAGDNNYRHSSRIAVLGDAIYRCLSSISWIASQCARISIVKRR